MVELFISRIKRVIDQKVLCTCRDRPGNVQVANNLNKTLEFPRPTHIGEREQTHAEGAIVNRIDPYATRDATFPCDAVYVKV